MELIMIIALAAYVIVEIALSPGGVIVFVAAVICGTFFYIRRSEKRRK